ncbi:MAG: alkaline phosphatase D family protein [Flavobacteriaceae bacterium]
MLYRGLFLILILLFSSCKSAVSTESNSNPDTNFTIAFGSCNKVDLPNVLWDDVLAAKPDIWIWGGDNIYADTDDVDAISSMYEEQKKVDGYQTLRSEIPVIGTWDDHDYGLNDGGVEWIIKDESQKAFLDFLDVPQNSRLRKRQGVYASHKFTKAEGVVRVFVLDTRYFRTGLTKDPSGQKRYLPNRPGEGTILGVQQWEWLEKELKESKADFNILVSSIQFLSDQHGFEGWGNFPDEVARMKRLIMDSGAKGVIILSGDRHISEFSSTGINGLSYPLIDFTSSGLTHVYSDYSGEPNPYRRGEVISEESFGLVKISLATKQVVFEIIGDEGKILARLEQQY